MSGLAAATSLDFAAVDALNDFGIDDNQSRELLGSYFLQVFNLSESSWKLHMLDRLFAFESPAVPLDKPLSSAMFLLGSSLQLDPDILAVLPFSDSMSVSPFSHSSETADFSVAFYTGFILLWALQVHVPNASIEALLPSVSASPVVPPSSATTVPFSPSSITSSTIPSTAPPLVASGTSGAVSLSESALSLFSKLSAQVQPLSTQVASLQRPSNVSSLVSSSPPPVRSSQPLSAPASIPLRFEHPMGPSSEGNSLFPAASLSDCSELFESPRLPVDTLPPPATSGARNPGSSLSPSEAIVLILMDCVEGSRLSPAKLAQWLSSGDVLLMTPSGGQIRVQRTRSGICFSVLNEAADRPGPGYQSLTSAPQFHWPQNRFELILWQNEHSDMLSRDPTRRLAAAGPDPSASAAVLSDNVAASRALHQFHQRAIELSDNVFSNSRATADSHHYLGLGVVLSTAPGTWSGPCRIFPPLQPRSYPPSSTKSCTGWPRQLPRGA